jgi:hypothetical protein
MMSSFRPFLLALFLVVSALAGTSDEGLKWLAQKKLEDGVVTRESGLLYKEIRPGNGTSIESSCHHTLVVIIMLLISLLLLLLLLILQERVQQLILRASVIMQAR